MALNLPNPQLTASINPTDTAQVASMPGFAVWVAAWLLIIGFLWMLANTKWGHPIVYYTMWMSIVFVLVTHYGTIQNIFNIGNITQGNI